MHPRMRQLRTKSKIAFCRKTSRMMHCCAALQLPWLSSCKSGNVCAGRKGALRPLWQEWLSEKNEQLQGCGRHVCSGNKETSKPLGVGICGLRQRYYEAALFTKTCMRVCLLVFDVFAARTKKVLCTALMKRPLGPILRPSVSADSSCSETPVSSCRQPSSTSPQITRAMLMAINAATLCYSRALAASRPLPTTRRRFAAPADQSPPPYAILPTAQLAAATPVQHSFYGMVDSSADRGAETSRSQSSSHQLSKTHFCRGDSLFVLLTCTVSRWVQTQHEQEIRSGKRGLQNLASVLVPMCDLQY